MNVAICFQYHDYQPVLMIVDTSKIKSPTEYEKLYWHVKDMLEDGKDVEIDATPEGEYYEMAEDFNLDHAKVEPPCMIHAVCSVTVRFE